MRTHGALRTQIHLASGEPLVRRSARYAELLGAPLRSLPAYAPSVQSYLTGNIDEGLPPGRFDSWIQFSQGLPEALKIARVVRESAFVDSAIRRIFMTTRMSRSSRPLRLEEPG